MGEIDSIVFVAAGIGLALLLVLHLALRCWRHDWFQLANGKKVCLKCGTREKKGETP